MRNISGHVSDNSAHEVDTGKNKKWGYWERSPYLSYCKTFSSDLQGMSSKVEAS